jgi:predicted metal-dependent peptidase
MLAGAITGIYIFPKIFRKNPPPTNGRNSLVKPFKTAKSELQSLQFEKNLVGQEIMRVYEAVQEGKIDRNEFDRLLLKYKNQLIFCDEKIDALQPLVDIAEVSEMRDDVLSLFERRVGAMDQKLAELCRKYGMSFTGTFKTIKMMQQQRPSIENENQESKDKEGGIEFEVGDVLASEKFKTNYEEQEGKSEEKSVEKLQKEIIEALSRLDQIEIEDGMPSSHDINPSDTLNDKSCLRQFR